MHREKTGEAGDKEKSQLTNRFNPRMYRMIFDILRFNLFALDLLKHEGRSEMAKMSIGEYLDKEGYGQAFKEDYLLVSEPKQLLNTRYAANHRDESEPARI